MSQNKEAVEKRRQELKQEKLNKQKLFEEAKESQMYKSVLKIFPDADLIDIKTYGDKDE